LAGLGFSSFAGAVAIGRLVFWRRITDDPALALAKLLKPKTPKPS
jgi:hypothetical protein